MIPSDEPTESTVVNGQVFLDGTDTLWVTSVPQEGHTRLDNGTWSDPREA